MSALCAAPASASTAASSDAELIARHDGRVPRYTSYPTAPNFTSAIGPRVYAQWLGELPAEAALSIYLHVPFCDRLCLYCGCNTTVVTRESSLRAYAALLMREIDHVARLIPGVRSYRMCIGAAARRPRCLGSACSRSWRGLTSASL